MVGVLRVVWGWGDVIFYLIILDNTIVLFYNKNRKNLADLDILQRTVRV